MRALTLAAFAHAAVVVLAGPTLADTVRPPPECASAKNVNECADILEKLGKNPFDAFGYDGRAPVYGGQNQPFAPPPPPRNFFYDWQTLIAGILAVFAAVGTILVTIWSANREIAVALKQIDETRRLARRRAASEGYAFHAMLEAAMGCVVNEATGAKKEFSTTGKNTHEAAYTARKCFSKKAFNELRAACVSHGGQLTKELLELENKIDEFASKVKKVATAPGDWSWVGDGKDLLAELDVIEANAKHLRQEADTGTTRANVVIDATET